MSSPTLIIGDGNWAVKSGLLLGYEYGELSGQFAPIPITGSRASTATYTDQSGLIVSASSGVLRVDYSTGTGSLLLEPQRTNLVLRSEDFGNTYWSKLNLTADLKATSPSGELTANILVEDNTTNIRCIQGSQISTFLAGVTQPVSLFIKKTNLRYAIVGVMRSSAVFGNYIIDLDNKTFVIGATLSTAAVSGGKLQELNDGWFRFSFNASRSSDGGLTPYFSFSSLGTLGDGGFGLHSYLGTNSSMGLIYGAQVEAGAYPSTYIPTTSTTATRIADTFSRPNIYTDGVITSGGGTWFVELRNNISYVRDLSTRIGVGDTSALNSNAIFLFPSSNGRLLVIKAISGSTTTLYTTTTDTVKIAIKWDGTTADVFANGTKVTSATSFTTTNMETLVGNVGTPVFISQSKLYNQPLSDAECISLTTL